MIFLAEARLAASIINNNSNKLSEFGNVDCTKYTSQPRIDSSYETTNSPSAKYWIFMLPSGQPNFSHTFSAMYLDFVPQNTLKGVGAFISINLLLISK